MTVRGGIATAVLCGNDFFGGLPFLFIKVSHSYFYSECCFCHQGPNKECGLFFHDENEKLAAHQFCLVCQDGHFDYRICGFLAIGEKCLSNCIILPKADIIIS